MTLGTSRNEPAGKEGEVSVGYGLDVGSRPDGDHHDDDHDDGDHDDDHDDRRQ